MQIEFNQINLAVAGIAVGTVMLPELSKHVKNNSSEQITDLQNRALELCLFLSVPAAAALVLASEEVVTSLFGYGSFNNASVINTAIALTFFAFGIPAFSILKIFSNFFFARNDTKTPFYLSVVSVTLNIIISVSLFSRIWFCYNTDSNFNFFLDKCFYALLFYKKKRFTYF